MSSIPVRATSAAVVYPIRQPRGPPPLEELLAKPTSKHEGSKNFAARRRRPQISGFVSTGVARTTSGNTSTSASVTMAPIPKQEGLVSEDSERVETSAAASISGFVSADIARTTSGNTSAAASGTIAPIHEHEGLISEEITNTGASATAKTTAPVSEQEGLVSKDTKNVTSSNANRKGR